MRIDVRKQRKVQRAFAHAVVPMFAGPVADPECRRTQQVGELLLVQPHQFWKGGFRLRRALRRTRHRTARRFLRLANDNSGLRHFCVRRRRRRQQSCVIDSGIGAALATRQQDRRRQGGDRHQAERRASLNWKFPREGQPVAPLLHRSQYSFAHPPRSSLVSEISSFNTTLHRTRCFILESGGLLIATAGLFRCGHFMVTAAALSGAFWSRICHQLCLADQA